MKNLIAFIAMIGMVAISTNIQAYCSASGGYAECYTTGSVSYDGTSYYATANSNVNFFWHLVNGSSQNGTYALVNTDASSGGQYAAVAYDSIYNGTSLPTNSGYFDIYVGTSNGGYSYVNATW